MSWRHQWLGRSAANTALAVDETHSAGRVAGRPFDVGVCGSYTFAVASGVMAAAMSPNSELFQFRWTDIHRLALLRSVHITSGQAGVTSFGAGHGMFSLTFARAWTVDGGGGTAVTFPLANDQKRRTKFAGTIAPTNTGVRVSATAPLTAGTKVLDTNPLTALSFGILNTAQGQRFGPDGGTFLWQRATHDDYPLLLRDREGLVIRGTVSSTGTWSFAVTIEWVEVNPVNVGSWL